MTENYMLKETLSYPSMIREVIEPLRVQAQQVLRDETIREIDCIYIYGSGDSLNAAVCAAQSFWEYAGVPAYPLTAMQASRYTAPCLDRARAARTLTICISNSGEAARSVEASMAMHAVGTISMAITANPNSRVGKAADYIRALAHSGSRHSQLCTAGRGALSVRAAYGAGARDDDKRRDCGSGAGAAAAA